MTILTALLIGIVATGVWEAVLSRAWDAYRERKGDLAGWWWLITYPPAEPGETSDMLKLDATASLGTPWSVELVRARHKGRDIKFVWWRVYKQKPSAGAWKPEYDNVWAASAKCRPQTPIINGHYWGIDGNASDGSFNLWINHKNRMVGYFSQPKQSTNSDLLSYEWERARLVCLRVDCEEEREEEIVARLLREIPPPTGSDAYPNRVHAILCGIVHGHPIPTSALLTSLGFVCAMYDPMPVTAVKRAQLRSADLTRQAPDTEE